MLTTKYKEEVTEAKDTIAAKKEYNPNLVKLLGAKYLTVKDFERDIAESNKFGKVKHCTKLKLIAKVDKMRVKEVFQSVRHVNREILLKNKITEEADDFVYLTIRMENSIRDLNAQLQTPVQVKLPHTLDYKDGLLIV